MQQRVCQNAKKPIEFTRSNAKLAQICNGHPINEIDYPEHSCRNNGSPKRVFDFVVDRFYDLSIDLFKIKAMKKAMIILSMFIATMSPQKSITAQTSSSYEVLQISGNIIGKQGNLEGVLVELFRDNEVVSSFESTQKGKYRFDLASGYIYTIQLSKAGFYTKRISVNTKIPAGYDDMHTFEMDFTLESVEEKNYDNHLIEYPAVLIAFDSKQAGFTFDREYTNSYVNELENSAK